MQKIKSWIIKRKGNLIFGIFLLLLIIPATREQMLTFTQRLLAGNPTEIPTKKQHVLPFLNWELIDKNEQSVNLKQSKGKIIIINRWATWCLPCRAEMPSFQKLYDKYKFRVDFYFITNEKETVINKFMQQNNYTFPIYQSASFPHPLLQLSRLPTTFVIGKQGEILIKETGVKDWMAPGFLKYLEAEIKS